MTELATQADQPSHLDGAPPVGCPICGGAGGADFQAGEHRMYRCRRCRAVFVHPLPSEQYLANFYATFHRPARQGGWYDEVESRTQADFPAKVRLVREFTQGSPGRLVDIGCGKGYFVKCCVDHGIDAEGVDVSESGVAHAVETLKVKATCGQFAAVRKELGQFDTATFWATIEHLRDPKAMLRDIYDCLRPGGHLFLDTGNGDDWLERLLPGRTQWYDPPQHLYVFSEESLRQAAQSVGFTVVHVDPCFERSWTRRIVRQLRNGVAASMLRIASTCGRMKQGTFAFTRFPMGNLMSMVVRKPLG